MDTQVYWAVCELTLVLCRSLASTFSQTSVVSSLTATSRYVVNKCITYHMHKNIFFIVGNYSTVVLSLAVTGKCAVSLICFQTYM